MERFVGVLIEHFAGAFPLWLAPEQVRVLPISEKSEEYALEVLAAIRKIGLRATIDSGNERVQARIRDASEAKIPYLAVVGPRDAQQRVVSVRAFGTEANLGELPFDLFISGLSDEYRTRGAESLKAAFPA